MNRFNGRPIAHSSLSVVLQRSTNDCAAAALSMVFAYHGIIARLEELTAAIAITNTGTDAGALLQVARRHGLRGWGSCRGDAVTVIDPQRGWCCITMKSLGRFSHGVALVFPRNRDDIPAQPLSRKRGRSLMSLTGGNKDSNSDEWHCR